MVEAPKWSCLWAMRDLVHTVCNIAPLTWLGSPERTHSNPFTH